MSRDHCSPCFRKGLQQEPLWLREREAANGRCLSADRSDMGWDNGKGQRCFITCGHLTAELGLLKPQPVPRAGGKEGASHCGENLPPSGVVLLCIMDLPHEPDGSPRLLPVASVPLVGEQQLSYLCSTPKKGKSSNTGMLGMP